MVVEEVGHNAPPLGDILDLGIPLGGGTDATVVSPFDPWRSIWWLVTGKSVGGTVINDPQNRLSREEALRLWTKGSAWFSGEDEIKGELSVGQLADFAILDNDYFSVDEYDYLVINDDFDTALGELRAIVTGLRLRLAPQAARHRGLLAELLAPAN